GNQREPLQNLSVGSVGAHGPARRVVAASAWALNTRAAELSWCSTSVARRRSSGVQGAPQIVTSLSPRSSAVTTVRRTRAFDANTTAPTAIACVGGHFATGQSVAPADVGLIPRICKG